MKKLTFDLFGATILNSGMIVVAITAAYLLVRLDGALGFFNFRSQLSIIFGLVILVIGIIFRFWASITFYQNNIRVLSLKPQSTFTKNGPYRFSRNPLYVGIVAIFLGIMLVVGSISGIISSVSLFIFWDLYIRFIEEKQLERAFGDSYREYLNTTSRWI